MGEEIAEVMGNRDADPNYEREAHAHRRKMSVRMYVDHVNGCSASNDIYLVANNHLLESATAAALWEDFSIDERYLDPRRREGSVFLWFGPAGTFTPLHHDVVNVLFVQILAPSASR